jgi:flagellar biosynthetic protein FliR
MEMDFYNWLLVFLRASAFLLVLPFFSMTNFPVTMRVAVGMMVSLLIAPTLPHFAMDRVDFLSLTGLMIREVSVGLLLGFVARLIFYAVELAGNVISTEIGLNTATLLDPVNQQSSQIAGTVLSLLAVAVMLTLNLHHWLLLGFQRTYGLLPIGGAHLNNALFEVVVNDTAQIFMIALQLAAPVMAVSFVITMIFAILSRAVPQMNIFSEMYGFRVVGGLIVFGFTLQLTAQYVVNYLHRLPQDLLSVAHLLGG